jgi:uncharacterized Zn-finger protein
MGIANGSAPVFKVAPSIHVSSPRAHRDSSAVNGIPNLNGGSVSPTGTNHSPVGYSSVITFPASDPGTAGSPESHSGAMADNDGFPQEKGKKHKCHICPKRFNRPSSLRIHVNTHTGATRMDSFLVHRFIPELTECLPPFLKRSISMSASSMRSRVQR